jgi:hypothetical protein
MRPPRILTTAGMPPVPERPTSWQTFLRAHGGAIAVADFFTAVADFFTTDALGRIMAVVPA